MYKLQNYEIRWVILQWFKSYHSNIKQFTCIGDTCSHTGSITVGVPQGSVLGLLLFILYINDIYNTVPGIDVKLFADDINLFLSGKNLVDLCSKENSSLEQLFKLFVVNRLDLNIDKTCYSVLGVKSLGNINLELKINDKNIQMVESCKYLNIFIDRSLSWKEHIDYLYRKLIKFTSIFYKIRTKLNNEVLKLLYFAFVYPHLLCGIETYRNTNHCHLIYKLEKTKQ